MSISNLSQNAEITQSGQASRINLSAFSGLSDLFMPSLGPYSSSKMLINATGIKILKDGRSLLDNIVYTHPVTNVINQAAKQNHDILGDGVCNFIVFGNFIFRYSVAMIEEMSVVRINEIIMNDLNILREILAQQKIQFDFEEELKKSKQLTENPEIVTSQMQNTQKSDPKSINSKLKDILFFFLNTKMDADLADHFSSLVLKAYTSNITMIEMIAVDGEMKDSEVIDGLVLDHSGRHPCMPKILRNAVVMISNMSFEYEKTEIHSQMHFRNVNEREEMIKSERIIVNRKIDKILYLKKNVEASGRKLVLMTERGIDLPSLDRLSGMLCLRRVKRRNLERLLRLCGGKIITVEDDIRQECLGFAGQIRVKEEKDKSYTFITQTPYTGAKTVLLSGNNSYEKERVKIALNSALKIMTNLRKEPCYIEGGPINFKKWSEKIEKINQKRTPVSEALYQMYKCIMMKIKNGKGDLNVSVLDSFMTVEKTLFNSGTVASTLLLVDEIIKAGKSVKEEQSEQERMR